MVSFYCVGVGYYGSTYLGSCNEFYDFKATMNIPLKGSGYGMYTTIITLCAHAQQGKAMPSCVCVCVRKKNASSRVAKAFTDVIVNDKQSA